MSHAQSKRYPEGRAAQPCSGFVALQTAFGSSLRACAHVLYLPSPGISLPAASTAPESACSCWGFQGCLYCQAVSNSDREAPSLCVFHRADAQQHCQPCGFAVFRPGIKTWLKSRRMASRWPFGWNIGLIACWPKSSHEHTNCWCPNGADWLTLAKFVARRC
jgi:hypothetical protein